MAFGFGVLLALIRSDSRKQFRASTDAVRKLIDINGAGAQHARADALSSYSTVLWGIGSMVAVAMAVGALVAWRMTRSVTQPLQLAAAATDRIAGGDLTADVDSRPGAFVDPADGRAWQGAATHS